MTRSDARDGSREGRRDARADGDASRGGERDAGIASDGKGVDVDGIAGLA